VAIDLQAIERDWTIGPPGEDPAAQELEPGLVRRRAEARQERASGVAVCALAMLGHLKKFTNLTMDSVADSHAVCLAPSPSALLARPFGFRWLYSGSQQAAGA